MRGKGNDHARLPLPDVGEAVADYLRFGRARTADRHLFVTVRASFTRLAPNTSVCGIVRQACQRAGIEPFGPHRLCHAIACDLLADGADEPVDWSAAGGHIASLAQPHATQSNDT